MRDVFQHIHIISERQTNPIETDCGKTFLDKSFTDFLKKQKIKR